VLTSSAVYRNFTACLADSLNPATAPALFDALPPTLRPHALLLKLWRTVGAVGRGPPPLDTRARLAPPRQRPTGGIALQSPWPRPTYLTNAARWQEAFTDARLGEMGVELGMPPAAPGGELHLLVFALECQEELVAWLALEYGRQAVSVDGGLLGGVGCVWRAGLCLRRPIDWAVLHWSRCTRVRAGPQPTHTPPPPPHAHA